MKRTYTIPLRRGYNNTPRTQRAKRAVAETQKFLRKHMKAETVKLGKPLNEHLWSHGIKNPPAKVTVVCEKTEQGIVYADLEGEQLPTQVKQESEPEETDETRAEKPQEQATTTSLEEVKGLGPTRIQALKDAGISDAQQLAESSVEELTEVEGVGEATAEKILAAAKEATK